MPYTDNIHLTLHAENYHDARHCFSYTEKLNNIAGNNLTLTYEC